MEIGVWEILLHSSDYCTGAAGPDRQGRAGWRVAQARRRCPAGPDGTTASTSRTSITGGAGSLPLWAGEAGPGGQDGGRRNPGDNLHYTFRGRQRQRRGATPPHHGASSSYPYWHRNAELALSPYRTTRSRRGLCTSCSEATPRPYGGVCRGLFHYCMSDLVRITTWTGLRTGLRLCGLGRAAGSRAGRR